MRSQEKVHAKGNSDGKKKTQKEEMERQQEKSE